MNRLLYKLIAWILIIAGIIYAILNLYFSFGAPTAADGLYEFGIGFLVSVLILVLSSFPGKYYLKISNDTSKQNKLTNSSLILTMIGMIWIILVFSFAMLSPCSHPNRFCFYCSGDCFGLLGVLIFGIFPAAFLYAMAVILLLVNKLKK